MKPGTDVQISLVWLALQQNAGDDTFLCHAIKPTVSIARLIAQLPQLLTTILVSDRNVAERRYSHFYLPIQENDYGMTAASKNH